MPFLDRFWWLRIVGAIGLVGVAIGMVAVGISSYQVDEEFHLGHETTWFTVGFAAFFIAVAIGVGVSAFYARRRKKIRRRALAGQPNAMPLARLPLHPERAPALSDEPLTLFWRPTKGTRRAALAVLLVGMPIVVAMLTLSIAVLVIAPHADGEQPWINWPFRIYSDEIPAVFAPVWLCAIALILMEFIPQARKKTFGISISPDGIAQHTPWGRKQVIPWAEIRLVEVSTGRQAARDYRVYGSRSVITWHDYIQQALAFSKGTLSIKNTAKMYEPVGLTLGDVELRSRDILNTIAARTGLALRTPNKSLQDPSSVTVPADAPRTAATGARRKTQRNRLGTVLILCILWPALAGITLLWPLTDQPALNIVSASSLMFCTVGYLVVLLIVEPLRKHRQRSEQPSVPLSADQDARVPQEPFRNGAEEYVVSTRVPLSTRMALFMTGLPLLPVGVAGAYEVWAILGTVAMPLMHLLGNGPDASPEAQALIYPHMFISGLLLMHTAIGLVLAILSLWVLRHSVETRATKAGLAMNARRVRLQVAWDAIDSLELKETNGTATYRVRANGDKTSLSWSSAPQLAEYPLDAQPLSAAALAALVERQTGLTLKKIDAE